MTGPRSGTAGLVPMTIIQERIHEIFLIIIITMIFVIFSYQVYEMFWKYVSLTRTSGIIHNLFITTGSNTISQS